MQLNKLQKKHAIAFDNHYLGIYKERWPKLKLALEKNTKHVALINKYAEDATLERLVVANVGTKYERNLDLELPSFSLIGNLESHYTEVLDSPELEAELDSLDLGDQTNKDQDQRKGGAQQKTAPKGRPKTNLDVYDKDLIEKFPPPPRDTHNRAIYYLLDAASLLPVQALKIEPDDNVLDMCAAPGGKTMAICQYLGPDGHLSSNDISPDRRIRLKNVLNSYLNPDARSLVKIVGMDATLMAKNGNYEEEYDKVLVDAPCSSERHVIHKKFYHTWSIQSINKNAKRQRHLLEAAIRSAKIGGTIVYSTCAINLQENDGVVRFIMCKYGDKIKVIRSKVLPIGEKTKYGCIILPDTNGYGPIFFAIIKKIAN